MPEPGGEPPGASAPRIGPREVVYANAHQQVYRVAADFGAYRKEYFVTDYGRRVGLVVLRGESVLLVRQYRLLIERLSWEIPGGRVDEGETFEAAAVRECREETGIVCRRLKPLLSFHPGLDTLHNPTQLFFTDEFAEIAAHDRHAGEVDHHVWLPLARCLEMIREQQIVDSLSIVALLAYHCLVARP